MSIFSKIKVSRPKRTVFNLSYSSHLSLPFGKLVPIMCEKVVPGDKFVHSHEFLLRFAPFIGQVFQSFQVKVDYFYVPSRLLWHNFERFLCEDDNSLYLHPNIDLGDVLDGEHDMTCSILDYLNIPTVHRSSVSPYYTLIDGSGTNTKIDALPFMALLKIFFDYYADENLTQYFDGSQTWTFDDIVQNFDDVVRMDGNTTPYISALYKMVNNVSAETQNPAEIFKLFTRAYPKDYFTSALPWAQRGPLVQIPLNGEGDVIVRGNMPSNRSYNGIGIKYENTPGVISNNVEVTLFPTGTALKTYTSASTSNPSNTVDSNTPTSGISSISQQENVTTPEQSIERIKLQAANNSLTFKAVNVNGTATITDLRTAMAVQAWLEKNARAGVRYKEQLMSHFGVRSKDYRLDRAQLLQSSKSTVSIGEVFTTAANSDGTFIPGLGVSTATGSNAVRPFKRFFDEHGYVIGFMTVYPTASYYQGVPRQFLELDKFDYYWPEFQHIGEQDIKNGELFLNDQDGLSNAETFGYTPRYAHYKARTSQVHGDFRTHLQYMYDGRSFLNAPRLNTDFTNVDVKKNNLYRIFNYTEESPFFKSYPVYCDFYHNFKAIRPMSYFGNPRIV